jgi:hypothetical protein
MDTDPTLKILKMVQEGFLTAEQGQRLIQELQQKQTEEPARELPREETTSHQVDSLGDLFHVVEEAGKTFTKGFEQLFGFASQTVKDGLGLGPQSVVLKVLDIDGVKERYQVTLPLKIFTALKPLLVAKPSLTVHPIQQIDYEALFRSLEAGETGKVFEYLDHDRGDRFEVWVI